MTRHFDVFRTVKGCNFSKVVTGFLFAFCTVVSFIGVGCQNKKKKRPTTQVKKKVLSKKQVVRFVSKASPCPIKKKKAKECMLWRQCPQKPAACYKIGLLYQLGVNDLLVPDSKKSMLFFKKACAMKHGDACLRLAYQEEQKLGGKSNSKLWRFFEKACSYKSGEACARVSQKFLDNPRSPQPKKAFAFAKKACLLGHPDSCSSVGEQLMQGREYVSRDRRKAYVYFSLACKIGFIRGCVLAGEALLSLPSLTYKEQKKVQTYFRMACSATHKTPRGCARLGELYAKGQGLKKDLKKAYTFFQVGCRSKIGFACYQQALFQMRGVRGLRRDRIQAMSHMKKGCSNGSAKACLFMVKHYKRRNIQRKVHFFLEKACGFFDNRSCSTLGRMFLRKKQFERARDFLQQACWGGQKKACQELKKLPSRTPSKIVEPPSDSQPFIPPQPVLSKDAPAEPPKVPLPKPKLGPIHTKQQIQ